MSKRKSKKKSKGVKPIMYMPQSAINGRVSIQSNIETVHELFKSIYLIMTNVETNLHLLGLLLKSRKARYQPGLC
jgi:hypothetical protein